MSKRSAQEQIERYQRKLRKLEEKEKQRRLEALQTQSEDIVTQHEIYNCSPPHASVRDDRSDHDDDFLTIEADDAPIRSPPIVEPDLNIPDPQPKNSVPEPPPASAPANNVAELSAIQENPTIPDLDPDLLLALGDATDDTPKFGPNIHPNLAERWLPILRKGLTKETKEKLMKEYLIPENCPLLQAPKLNPEISAATTDMVRNRDKKLEAIQQQLGVGISAVNKSLTLLLAGEDKVSAIKHLSDGCRVLSDLHFLESQARIKLVTPGLAKPFLNIIQDNERDEYLFGSKLPEKIKASKAIEKQGLQIKKPVTKHSSPANQTSTNSRAQYQGNWQSTSRFPSNRGGRGGSKKPSSTATGTARRTNSQPQSRPAGQSKSRATPQ